jgi:pre-mRNA-splicing factor ISY1
MLFRFREAQAADLGIIDAGRTRRPRVITEQDSIQNCEKWRGQVLKEISRKVSKIQEPSLSDYQIRDLNDEINKLMREKHMWEVQIRNLGGPNYMRSTGKIYDENGREIPGAGGGRGYKYFGRAKELPGVKELFEAAKAKAVEKEKPLETRDDLRKQVDAAYYGYAPDEEDESLLMYEAEKEREAFENLAKTGAGRIPPDGWEPLPGDAGDGHGWVLPTLDEVQEELINRRRQRLLEQL